MSIVMGLDQHRAQSPRSGWTRVIAEYFGTPGPDTATQVRWSRDIFQRIFLNVTNGAVPHQRALAAAAEIRPHLDAQTRLAAALNEGDRVLDDVLTRLLQQPPRRAACTTSLFGTT